MFNRVFLIVLDSLGIGDITKEENTLLHAIKDKYNLNVLETLGLTALIGKEVPHTRGLYMKCNVTNKNNDSLGGHYEMMGARLKKEYSTYKDGLPLELVSKIQHEINMEVIGNEEADGVKIINDLGPMHIKTKCPIIYTSEDSVLQVACHEDVMSPNDLYDICEKIYKIVSAPEYNIARVIARPFTGKNGTYQRLNKRKDFTSDPPVNVLDILDKKQINTICIGKIGDLFNNKSISVNIRTSDNIDTMMKVIDFAKGNKNGLIFANFNDFDSLYGHRRDREGYLKSLEEFNYYLPILLKNLKKEDLLIICADHGCDPTYKGHNHTKEKVPVLLYSPIFKKGKMLGDRETLADIGATILDNFNLKNTLEVGNSIFDELRK